MRRTERRDRRPPPPGGGRRLPSIACRALVADGVEVHRSHAPVLSSVIHADQSVMIHIRDEAGRTLLRPPTHLVGVLGVRLGVPRAHGDDLAEQGQDARPGLLDDLLSVAGKRVDHASPVRHGAPLPHRSRPGGSSAGPRELRVRSQGPNGRVVGGRSGEDPRVGCDRYVQRSAYRRQIRAVTSARTASGPRVVSTTSA